MNKRKYLIIFSVLFLGLGFSIYQYYSSFKAELVSATSTVPNPGHLWNTMECNSDSLCIDNTNKRLGIGTAAPGRKLEVKGDSFAITHTTSNNIMGYLGQRGSGVDAGYLQLNNAGTSTVAIDTNGVSYFNGGNIGIGIAAPTQKLDVVGSIKASGDICSSGICLNQVAQYYNTNPLYNSTHTIANCMTVGGTVIANPDGSGLPICKITNAAGASCSSGWTQYKGYSTFVPGTGCGGAWANVSPTTQTSLYCINADRNDDICYCGGSTNIFYPTASDGGFCICSSTATTRTEIGCY